MYKRILVAVDGSDTAKRGLQEAVKLTKALDAQLKIVHIVDDSALAMNPETGIAAAPLVEDFAEGGKQIVEQARAQAKRAGVEAEVALHANFTGRVANLIADEAKKWRADLIVMGTHARGGVKHALLGSEAESVVHASEVPVLLVRAAPSK